MKTLPPCDHDECPPTRCLRNQSDTTSNETNQDNVDLTCVNWALDVLRARGLDDWKVTWSPEPSAEGITISDSREIIIHWPEGNPDYALMAHEIAHAVRGLGGHDGEFAYQYMKIVDEFFIPTTAIKNLKSFIESVARQRPEKPDHWSACSQCERNIDEAQDIIARHYDAT